MPPQLLFDISGIDLDRVIYDQESIRGYNPHRGDMEQLNGIVYLDDAHARLIGFKDVRADEFWVAGHIPGRPLMPGVLMVEAGAQLASFYIKKCMRSEGFIGFGGQDCKFRQQVKPGCRLYILAEKISERHGRIVCNVQGLVEGSIVFECTIVGMALGK